MENNFISISGKVIEDVVFSHEIYGEVFYKIKIECNRTSGSKDYLNIIISDRIMPHTLNVGDIISVDGSIRTRNNECHLVTNIFADTLDIINIDDSFERIDINEIILNGYICKKNKIRNTPGSNRTITDFIIAVNRPYGKSDYIPCVAWSRNAKFIDALDIGKKILIKGRLQSRLYEKLDGEHYAYEVSIQSLCEQD